MCSHVHPRQWLRRIMGMHSYTMDGVEDINKIWMNQWAVMGALRILHIAFDWPSFIMLFSENNSISLTTNSLTNLFFLLNNHRLLLPLLSAGPHLPPPHLSMPAVSTPSKRSASVTGKTCVNSRGEESVELAERRWWGRLHLVLSVLLRMSLLPSALWLFHPLTLRRRLK